MDVQKEAENIFDDVYHIKTKEVINLIIIAGAEGIDVDVSNNKDSVMVIKICIIKWRIKLWNW